ncbi:maternal protein exuperantia-like isoform X2 [Temnothorax nylanderi]|uniref:maternal protein exuperantia-like isoform X2 n=1 Tax=Temnothorax nylanderi TaxID=102681 RepID=UPI003A84383C
MPMSPNKTYQSVRTRCGAYIKNKNDLLENTPRAMNDPNNFEDDNYRIVYFDLETTGLRSTDQICQIAAYDGVSTFNAYITPSIPISRSASAITGMQIIDGDMYVHEDLVQTIPVRAALDGFLKYLEEISGKENKACQIILLSHNGFKFDVPRILFLVVKLGVMETFKKTVSGFADTLDILRNALPERRKNKQSFSVKALLQDFLPGENHENLHNAVDDVIMLKKIIDYLKIDDLLIKKFAKSVTNMIE